MPYNPRVQDRSGEYIGQGLQNFGASIGGAIQKQADARTQTDHLRASLEEMRALNPDLVSDELMEKFESGSLGAKQGIYANAKTLFEQENKLQLQADRIALQKDLAIFKAAQDASRPPIEPLFTETHAGTVVTNPRNGTNMLLPLPQAGDEPRAPVIDYPVVPGTNTRLVLEDGEFKGSFKMDPQAYGPPAPHLTPKPNATAKAIRQEQEAAAEEVEPGATRAEDGLFTPPTAKALDDIMDHFKLR